MAADPCNELLYWKLVGAAAWHAVLFWFSYAMWQVLATLGSLQALQPFALSTWTKLLLLHVTSLTVLYAQRRLIACADVPPIISPRLGLGGKSWISLFVSRCLVRNRTLSGAADAAFLFASCAFTGAVGVYSLSGVSSGNTSDSGSSSSGEQHTYLVAFGILLGFLYAALYLIRAGNVLSYPVLQRHRYFRLRQRFRAVARTAVLLASGAALTAALLAQLPAALLPAAPLGLALRAWRAAVLCVFAWQSGAYALEVVFTERVAFTEADKAADPNPVLIAALKHTSPLVQDWARLDLVGVAEGAARTGARRAAVFADETGSGGWVPLVSLCLVEVDDLVALVAAALPSLAAGAQHSGSGAPRWNVLQVSATGFKGSSREQELAVWHMQSRYYRVTWAMRTLAGLAAASLHDDTYGVAQLRSPNLADVLLALLAATKVLQLHVRSMSVTSSHAGAGTGALLALSRWLLPQGGGAAATPAWLSDHHVDAAAYALLDVASSAAYRVANTFGDVLLGVLGNATRKPSYGSADELKQLLSGFLEMQE